MIPSKSEPILYRLFPPVILSLSKDQLPLHLQSYPSFYLMDE